MSACDEAGGADRGPDQVLAPLTGDETRARFFDAAWPEHPCGASDALMLAALAKTAREHGGRGRVHADAAGTVTFVIPRPLNEM